jgi:hypothetical protein
LHWDLSNAANLLKMVNMSAGSKIGSDTSATGGFSPTSQQGFTVTEAGGSRPEVQDSTSVPHENPILKGIGSLVSTETLTYAGLPTVGLVVVLAYYNR